MLFSPLKHKCPKCGSHISSEIEINEDSTPRYKRVSDWTCDNGHVITNKELLDKLESSIKSFNLTAP